MNTSEICKELGINRTSYYRFKKLPGFPLGGTVDAQRAFLTSIGKIKNDTAPENFELTEGIFSWDEELKMWKAINEKQKSKAEKNKIIQEAKEEILAEAREFLDTLKKKFKASSFHRPPQRKSTLQLRRA